MVKSVQGDSSVLPNAGPAPAGGPAPANHARGAKSVKSAAAAYSKDTSKPTLNNAANVHISKKGKEIAQRNSEMKAALEVAKNTPDVDQAKVDKYRELIAKGAYKPNAEKIADGMAREALMNKYATNKD